MGGRYEVQVQSANYATSSSKGEGCAGSTEEQSALIMKNLRHLYWSTIGEKTTAT